MKIRKTDCKLLKKLIRSHELDNMRAIAKQMGVSATILGELINGRYKPQVKETTRAKICDFLGASEDELFPFVGANEDKAS